MLSPSTRATDVGVGPPSDMPPTDADICVIGAGPHGLAIVAHLLTAKPALRERLAIVDPTGCWMRTWHDQFARLEIGVLRSPIVHHPDVDPGALARYVDDHRKQRSNLPYDPPLVDVFTSFCSEVIERFELGDAVTTGRVTELTTGDANTITTTAGTIEAQHIVWAANTATPIIPWALRPAVDSGAAQHGLSVDLPTIGSLDGEHVVIVGGGLTAGHLAMGAVERRARVTLITRRPIVERDFDVEPGWLGPRHLAGFWRAGDPQRRIDTARAARGGGTMPRWMRRQILDQIRAGRIAHCIDRIDTAPCDAEERTLQLGDGPLAFDRCWLATGTRPDVRADDALRTVIDDHIDGFPLIDPNLRVRGRDVYMTGRLALMELGPAAGNLWGARTAARRITRALTDVDLDTDSVTTIRPNSTIGAAK